MNDFAKTRAATETGLENWEGINAFHEGQQRAMIGAVDTAEQNPRARTETTTDNPHPSQETSDSFQPASCEGTSGSLEIKVWPRFAHPRDGRAAKAWALSVRRLGRVTVAAFGVPLLKSADLLVVNRGVWSEAVRTRPLPPFSW